LIFLFSASRFLSLVFSIKNALRRGLGSLGFGSWLAVG
jgi:hypothetical protein